MYENQTMERLIEKFISYLKEQGRSKQTTKAYTSDLSIFLSGKLKMTLNTIVEEELEENLDKVMNRLYEPATLERKKQSWNGFCKFIRKESWKIIKKIGKNKTFQRDVITDAQIKRMIEYLNKKLSGKSSISETIRFHRQKILLMVGQSLGLRCCEYENLSYSDIFDKGEIRIRNSKSNNYRKIPVTDDVKAAVEALHKFCVDNKIEISDGVFRNSNGGYISTRTLQRWIKQLAGAVGVPANLATTHSLRHRFAKAYYKISRSLPSLANLLGHSSVNTTRIYLSSSYAEVKSSLERASNPISE